MLLVRPKETVSMHTRDGVRLDADIYYPQSNEQFPVLLMRQPYGRAIASTVVYAHPTWYAAQGYIVVIQDVRGRGTSAGNFELFTHEIADGEDTVNWVANLPGSNGMVGMYGFSYQGMTQLYAAIAKPPGLKTICPAMVGYDLYTDWAYEGGAFCLQTNLAWAIQLATETARLRQDQQAYQELSAAARNLPLHHPELLQNLAQDSFYHQWLGNPQSHDYWAKLSPKTQFQDVDLPMFHIGGWFDTYLRGTMNLYRDMAARSQYRQQLLVGPWTHLPWGRRVGEVDFGHEAMSPVDRMQICWFDQFLKGKNTGLLDEVPVWLFEMGTNMWQGFPTLNSSNQKSYYLSSTGLASVREDEGTLIQQIPKIAVDDVFVHDPWRPVPSLGGHGAIPAGVFERSHIDCRGDVLTYTTEPMTENLYLAGETVVEIWCQCDTPKASSFAYRTSYDLCAVLSEVFPNNKVYNFAQGYLRCQLETSQNTFTKEGRLPRKASQKVITLQATCTRIAKGHALRLSLSAACFPAYNLNIGSDSGVNLDGNITTITVKSGGSFPSRILLPVVPPSK